MKQLLNSPRFFSVKDGDKQTDFQKDLVEER